MELPGITGLSASVSFLNSWFSGWTVGLINHLEINGPLVTLAAAKGWA